MNRSTGLLRAYADLLRRVSGADAVSLYAPPLGGGNPVLLHEGGPPVPELRTLDSARVFRAACERLPVGPSCTRIDSEAPHSWILAVPCAPVWRPAEITGGGKRTKERKRRANDAAVEKDEPPRCWIGLSFPGEEAATEAFRILTENDVASKAGRGEWSSLPHLGGVLAWYGWHISSLLDDPVTGLAGRAEFQAALSQAFDEARAASKPLALLFVNPDDFTAVNERFGHEAGDRVLREIGERLRGAHRSSDAIAKYGGAIFASFLDDADLDAARVVAEKIWTTLSATTYLDGTARLGISVGLAVFDPADASIDGHLELIRRADKALNAAKRFGGGHVVAWEPELDSKDIGNVDRMTGVYTGNMAKDYRNMTLLSDTMTAVAGSADTNELVERVVERLYRTLRADRVGILEWSIDGAPALLKGLTKRASPDGGQEPTDGLALDESQLAFLETARQEKRALLVSLTDDYSDEQVLSFAVPLLLNGRVLGCVYLDGRSDALALDDSSDLGFLRAFGTQLAVALDRARLSEEQQRQKEKEHVRLKTEVNDLRKALKQSQLVHRSGEMQAVLDTVRRVAPTRATVLVTGESGTGKELIARTIHELSPYRRKPLVVVDCGAIPTTLIESELFGHERGAYTGAQERRIGRLLEAEGGTVVLDEIGELPLEVQSKLLRFVQERQLVPVGGTQVRRVEARVIAVTNRDLAVEAAEGRFREDLYYRLNVVRVTVPPLRERPEDILHIADHFLEHFSGQYQTTSLRFTEEARTGMKEYSWPGNVRELQNRIMQAVILSERDEIGLRELELDGFAKTVELDRVVPQPTRAALVRTGTELTPEQAWRMLREGLRRQIEGILSGGGGPVPIGSWLEEDLVLHAYRAAGSIPGRGKDLLGVPETTFRRRLGKVLSQERAGLLTRMPPWNDFRSVIDDLVRTPAISREDVIQQARVALLEEVVSRVDDPSTGAALMGVTVRTFRRWTEAPDTLPAS